MVPLSDALISFAIIIIGGVLTGLADDWACRRQQKQWDAEGTEPPRHK